jgi:hypothetical protein
MAKPWLYLGLIPLALLVGCSESVSTGGSGGSGGSGGGATTTSSTATTTSATTSTGTGPLACAPTSTSNLAGVHIEIDASACTFSLSDPALVVIPYRVVVDQDVFSITPKPQDLGHCEMPGPSGLITLEKVDGGQDHYCLCDVGFCANPMIPPVTLKQGSYDATFTWDERNWYGPSDTDNPEGAPFPVGDYTLTVSAIGVQSVTKGDLPFEVSATLPIRLVP